MIKNIIKLLGLGVAVVCVATTQQSYAWTIENLPVVTSKCDSNSAFNNYCEQSQSYGSSTDVLYVNNSPSTSQAGAGNTWYSPAGGTSYSNYGLLAHHFSLILQREAGLSYTRKYNYSFIRYNKDSSNSFWNFGIYSANANQWSTISSSNLSGLNYTFSDGQTLLLDEVYFFHDSIVFVNSSTNRSLQYQGQYTLEDYIFYSDPIESNQNVWLINLSQGKAWSLHIDSKEILSNLMMGKTSQTVQSVTSLGWEMTYNVVQGGSLFWPSTAGNVNKDDNYRGRCFNYSLTSFSSPNYSDSINDDNSSNNYFDANLVTLYNKCVNKGENLRKYLHIAVLCANQESDSDFNWENILINKGNYYTGNASYCVALDSFTANLYQVYSGNWTDGIINDNVDLQDFNAPFNDLVYSWYYNSVFLDSNHNVSGLPNGNAWCSAYTVDNFYEDQKTYVEKVADSLNDFFGSGVMNDYLESVEGHSSFSGLITSIKNGSTEYFTEYLFDPFTEMFNSGYNAFHNKFGVSSCSEINSVFGEMQLGNIALYVVGVLFIFILILCF